jgi:hypothetical protein
MKRHIETMALERKVTRVSVCDKCGLEPDDDMVTLYRDLEREMYENGAPVPTEWAPQITRRYERSPTRESPVHQAMTYVIPAETALVVEEYRTDKDGFLTVCRDCYEELFGWTTDTNHND